ncbi:MAG: RlpA-like double-psi beta-barrel-protein domain-containing protein-containing protein, partial [Piptocephalis tieghemiana]
SGLATYYAPGLGACGFTSKDSQMVAAVSGDLYGNNPNTSPFCKKKARVSAGGKSITVTLVDKCPGCESTSLDLSSTAFVKLFNSTDAGKVPIKWTVVG